MRALYEGPASRVCTPKWGNVLLVLGILLLSCTSCIGQRLAKYNIDANSITVSGVSSGGAMAIQMHVAYSSMIKGVGAFAAPPYWCAEATLNLAVTACTITPRLINLAALWAGTTYAYNTRSIDNPTNLRLSRVWLFSGTRDSVVVPGVVAATQRYYQSYIPSNANILVGNIGAEHAWITNQWGNACTYKGTPYINNCGFDGAQSLLSHIYNSTALKPRVPYISQNLKRFSQSFYTPGQTSPSRLSLGDTGFIYVPSACQSGSRCKLHISFHGCAQCYNTIGDAFVVHSGLNEWAESNNIIVVYPQTTPSSLVPLNPQGCWDWWGYTGTAYATKLGPQMVTIQNIIQAVTA